jgi:glycosyltransferase involved in cell wall biosynthesis
MRVLLLGLSLRPESGGGYTFSQDVFRALMRAEGHKHQFYVVDSPQLPPSLPKTFSRIPVSQRAFRHGLARLLATAKRCAKRYLGLGGGGQAAFFLPGQNAQLRKHRLDCALSLNPGEWSPILPNICTVLDLEHRRKPYFPELANHREWNHRERFYRRVLPRALTVIAGTTTGKAQIEHFYGVDQAAVRVIPFPTPSFALDEALIDAANGALPGGVDGEFLFYPAQYWAHKNHFRLLKAVQILREVHGWQGQLVCCGSDKGNLNYLIEQAVELRVAGQVRFLGFVKLSELIALYRHALALTFVSYFGPDNLPPLEAFALGCPVIASAIEGVEEQLGQAALYAKPDSATEIVEAILRLKNEHGLRDALVTAGKIRAAKVTPDNYAASIIGLLDTLELRFECFRR